MTMLTRKMYAQIEELKVAASAGLSADLRRFINLSSQGIRLLDLRESIESRQHAQAYIDTLTDLVHTKVNSK